MQQVGVPGEIRRIGADTPHGDAEGVEGLPQSTQEDIAVHLGEIGFEEESDTLFRPRQQARGHDNDDEQQEEHGHHELGGALNAVADAVLYNDITDDHDDQHP